MRENAHGETDPRWRTGACLLTPNTGTCPPSFLTPYFATTNAE